MKIEFKILHLNKRFPLAISRGVSTGSDNLFVSVTHQGITGWGELSPGKNEGAATAEQAQNMLSEFFDEDLSGLSIHQIHQRGREQNIAACALAGLDIALWDWLGKKANLPLYRLLGISKPSVPTSVTIGINSPQVVKQRVPLLLQGTGIKSLKIKLGSPEGIEADQAMFMQVAESTKPYDVNVRVDANGGWSVKDAIFMMKWLAERNTDYVEQPLAEGQESELAAIFKNRPLPVYLDESCRYSKDIVKWADTVDGVNLKLMKCGGITEALRIISVARAFNLKTMIGCKSESSMSISAGASITGLLDHIDLDSHLNLAPDPCCGAELIDGIVVPNDLPGHGASIKP
ncbi:mandelate racemase/muconate lactonizing enzyme family protein [Candidatus Spongiihabitans sp.]|uniref:mandelate racemase/muconate lactonizing enzyme family protein n=1 Tax=Candidatus Spongiihabitans sp. TaxID=3101308 RepID=UPI003C7B0BFA